MARRLPGVAREGSSIGRLRAPEGLLDGERAPARRRPGRAAQELDPVTVRDRDTMTQERVALDQVQGYLAQRLVGC